MPKTFHIVTPVFPRGIDVQVQRAKYYNGGLAVLLLSPDGEPIFEASTNTELPLAHSQFVCKNYSENEGLDIALMDAGIAKRIGATVRVGYATCPIMELLETGE